jgi:saccharopine dehydrogenase (NAD+, L-lysine forming)
MLKIGLIEEKKTPPDQRVVLTPGQCKSILETYAGRVSIFVEPSPTRCFPDLEYAQSGAVLSSDLSSCDLLLGVKEVPIHSLYPNKTYCFFAHVIKGQPYNMPLLASLLEKNIRLVDFETMTFENGERVIGFGEYAGIVGAYNGFRAMGVKTGAFELIPAHVLGEYKHMVEAIKKVHFPYRIALTGSGRVAKGAEKLLQDAGYSRISPQEYLTYNSHKIGKKYVLLKHKDLFASKQNAAFDRIDFFKNPQSYKSCASVYWQHTDLLINGIYWDEKIPRLFEKEEIASPGFSIQAIADVSCDINGSIPITRRVSTIQNPFYGIHKKDITECSCNDSNALCVMAIANLPAEIPREASLGFGNMFIEHVLPEFLIPNSAFIQRATICENGVLSPSFSSLYSFVKPK